MNDIESCQRLKKHLTDTVLEFHVKLGYSDEPIALWYPADSLVRLMKLKDASYLPEALEAFAGRAEAEWGRIGVSRDGDRYCLRIPEKGIRFIHQNEPDPAFLRAFIKCLSKPGVDRASILETMRVFSPDAAVVPSEDAEFDCMAYFEGGQPDEYIYCVKFDMMAATYHRLTREDYNALYSS